ncbi:MAG: Eco57I restriction-modification methylase domain-containing protein [Polyangiaceae bacterium]|nr:Eco57I restriction-modification methylase domain-containing protein [Polyangiaceae bacterium]
MIVADFLLAPEVDGLVARLKAPLGFLIGNPPYVSATRINDAQKRRLRGRFQSAGGRLDLYAVFIERALELLPSGGRVAFVTPDKFLVSQSGRGLREHILTMSAVRSVAQFKSHKVFDDAATVPCVTVLERAGSPAPVASFRVRKSRRHQGSWMSSTAPRSTMRSSDQRLGIASQARRPGAPLRKGHPTLASVAFESLRDPRRGVTDCSCSQRRRGPTSSRATGAGGPRSRCSARSPWEGIRELQVLLPYTYDFAGTPNLVSTSTASRVRVATCGVIAMSLKGASLRSGLGGVLVRSA